MICFLKLLHCRLLTALESSLYCLLVVMKNDRWNEVACGLSPVSAAAFLSDLLVSCSRVFGIISVMLVGVCSLSRFIL